jgi:hypothetical protein
MRNQGISCDILAFSTQDWGKSAKKKKTDKKTYTTSGQSRSISHLLVDRFDCRRLVYGYGIANVMLLFDEFPAYKQVLYENIIESLLLDKIRYYDLALVMPFANE